jgi:hypothetical protein
MKDYSREEAIAYIKENRTISTLCLKSLNIQFDSFLVFAQLDENTQGILIDQLIARG